MVAALRHVSIGLGLRFRGVSVLGRTCREVHGCFQVLSGTNKPSHTVYSLGLGFLNPKP